jgi:hypothetical protein
MNGPLAVLHAGGGVGWLQVAASSRELTESDAAARRRKISLSQNHPEIICVAPSGPVCRFGAAREVAKSSKK